MSPIDTSSPRRRFDATSYAGPTGGAPRVALRPAEVPAERTPPPTGAPERLRDAWVGRAEADPGVTRVRAELRPAASRTHRARAIGAPEPFRGGQEARPRAEGTATTAIGTTQRAGVSTQIAVTERNFELLRRFDRNGDGVLERGEVQEAMRRAGVTRVRNESAELSAAERAHLVALHQGTGGPISLTHGGARIGAGEGQTPWSAVERGLARDAASQVAPLGTVGQSRPSNLSNLDCGPAGGLYMNDRRIRAATGAEPRRTHAEADAIIRRLSASGGTTAPQMAGVMNDHFRHAGGRYYTHAAHAVNADNLGSVLRSGLASDPGGVMVPTISTANEADQTGTRHWLVVTGFDGTNVTYYDPAGPDGARHERTMTLEELRDALPAENAIMPNQVVYGTSVPESSVAGALPAGRRIGELEVRLANRDLSVRSSHGVYGNRADAQREAQRVAASTGEDAIVRREGQGYAVYGITEIRSQFGGLWSDNTLADLDRDITDVYMTDPTSGSVRRARSGP